MKRQRNPGRQMHIKGPLRENYKGPLVGRTDEVRSTGEDLIGTPKPGNTGQEGPEDQTYDFPIDSETF